MQQVELWQREKASVDEEVAILKDVDSGLKKKDRTERKKISS